MVVVDELCIEVLEKLDVPVDHDDPCVVLFRRVLPQSVPSVTYLFAAELVPELVQDVVEVILVLHDRQHQLQHQRVDVVHHVLELPLLGVDQDDLDHLWELLLKHIFHEVPLVSFDLP